jgi:malate dehydrogenase
MMRLDHNRALSQLAQKLAKPVASVRKVTVWGNHSATQYPDVFQAECDGSKAWPLINDQSWLEGTFIPTVQKRGAAIIEARGLSSAASAASAAIDPRARLDARLRERRLGVDGDSIRWHLRNSRRRAVRPSGDLLRRRIPGRQGVEVSDFSRKRMDATLKELHEERDGIRHLLG